MIMLNLSAETEARLNAYAARMGKNVHEIIAEDIARLLEDEDDECPLECQGEPNATTLESIAQRKRGEGQRFSSFEALMADLHADD